MDKAGPSQGPFEEKLGFICRIRQTLAALQSSSSCKCLPGLPTAGTETSEGQS